MLPATNRLQDNLFLLYTYKWIYAYIGGEYKRDIYSNCSLKMVKSDWVHKSYQTSLVRKRDTEITSMYLAVSSKERTVGKVR
jgi:hypothetical protein